MMSLNNVPSSENDLKNKKGKRKSRSRSDMSHSDSTTDKPSRENRESSKSCTAVDLDTITCIGEQYSPDLKLSKEIVTYLADDVTFKLRELLHNARIRMRHSKRRALKKSDVNKALECANVEKIFGPVALDWSVTDEYYSTVDPVVDLGDLAFETSTFFQDGPPYLKSEWLTTPNHQLAEQKYYNSVCECIFSENMTLTQFALQNLRTNKRIGNIINQLCTFCFLAYIPNKGNRLTILKMLQTITQNPCSSLTEPGNALKLLCSLFVSELFSINKYESKKFERDELHDSITNTLIKFLKCWNGLEPVILASIVKCVNKNLAQYIPLNIVRVIAWCGLDILTTLFLDNLSICISDSDLEEIYWPYVSIITNKLKDGLQCYDDISYDLRHSIWFAAAHVFRALSFTSEWSKQISQLLGDSCVPIYPLIATTEYKEPLYPFRKEIRLMERSTYTVTRRIHYPEEEFEEYAMIEPFKPILITYGKIIQMKTCSSAHQRLSYNNPIDRMPSRVVQQQILTKKLHLRRHNQSCKSHNLFFSL